MLSHLIHTSSPHALLFCKFNSDALCWWHNKCYGKWMVLLFSQRIRQKARKWKTVFFKGVSIYTLTIISWLVLKAASHHLVSSMSGGTQCFIECFVVFFFHTVLINTKKNSVPLAKISYLCNATPAPSLSCYHSQDFITGTQKLLLLRLLTLHLGL
jgi:hypothetical protein